MTLPTFRQIEDALRRANVLVDAAECHGTLCGLLSAGKAALKQQWLAQTLEDTDPANAQVGECRRLLDDLWNATHDALRGEEFDFEPLLPEADAVLVDR